MIKRLITYMMLCFCVGIALGQDIDFEKTLDSIRALRELSKNSKLTITDRIKHTKSANKLSNELKIDSITLATEVLLSNLYLRNNDFIKSFKLGYKALKHAKNLKDTVNIAISNHLIGVLHGLKGVYSDSAYLYFKRSTFYYKKKNKLEDAIVCNINSASVLNGINNYFTSNKILTETINDIKKVKKLNKKSALFADVYTYLGLNSSDLKLYDKALEFYKKAAKYNENIPIDIDANSINGDLKLHIENLLSIKICIAEVYKYQKKYDHALNEYTKIFKEFDIETIKKKDSSIYAHVRNNQAYNLYKTRANKNIINKYFLESHKIFLSLNDQYNISASGNDFSEFLFSINKKDSAKILSLRSFKLAKSKKHFEEASRAMLMLSKLEEGEKGKAYLYEYISLQDSLLQLERLNRNKFARIQFETDTYIEENEKLEERNTLISVFSIIAIVILLLLFVIANQIAKNQKLKFEQAQQQANADIYNLMLNEQHKIQEGRLNERYHIAEELHDGVLNTLAGTRMGIEYLSTLHPEAIKKYELYITELQKTERDIRNLSHSLKHSKLDAQQGFMSIVENYCENTSKLHRFECNITEHQDIDWESITDLTKVNLFRILQEALHNVVKHANASTVNISFNLHDNEKLQITITDNGNGFDTSQKAEGIGLQNIHSRCERLSGQCEISAVIGKGTTLTINVPV